MKKLSKVTKNLQNVRTFLGGYINQSVYFTDRIRFYQIDQIGLMYLLDKFIYIVKMLYSHGEFRVGNS